MFKSCLGNLYDSFILTVTPYDMFFALFFFNPLSSEALFGIAPFASASFAELEMKIRSTDPITVRNYMIVNIFINKFIIMLI